MPVAAGSDELLDALVQTSFTVMAVLNRVGAEGDLSLTQLRVLAILRDRRLRMGDLADYLGLEKSTMTGLVDRATARGLLRREPSRDDGRAYDVVITRAGARLVDRLYERVADSLAPLTGRLAAADRRRLRDLLTQLVGAA